MSLKPFQPLIKFDGVHIFHEDQWTREVGKNPLAMLPKAQTIKQLEFVLSKMPRIANAETELVLSSLLTIYHDQRQFEAFDTVATWVMGTGARQGSTWEYDQDQSFHWLLTHYKQMLGADAWNGAILHKPWIKAGISESPRRYWQNGYYQDVLLQAIERHAEQIRPEIKAKKPGSALVDWKLFEHILRRAMNCGDTALLDALQRVTALQDEAGPEFWSGDFAGGSGVHDPLICGKFTGMTSQVVERLTAIRMSETPFGDKSIEEKIQQFFRTTAPDLQSLPTRLIIKKGTGQNSGQYHIGFYLNAESCNQAMHEAWNTALMRDFWFRIQPSDTTMYCLQQCSRRQEPYRFKQFCFGDHFTTSNGRKYVDISIFRGRWDEHTHKLDLRIPFTVADMAE